MPLRWAPILILLAVPVGVTFGFEQVSGSKRPWQEWPAITTAAVSLSDGTAAREGDHVIRAFFDPEHPSDVLLYPTCWLIRRTERNLTQVGCGYTWRLVGGRLMFDYTYRGEKGSRLAGVAWDDFKGEVSFFSFLFRRPRFGSDKVEFYDEGRWLAVTGLPALDR